MKKIALILILLLLTLRSGCFSSDPKLAKSMTEKYSNNGSYVSLSGEIIKCHEKSIVIKCEELKDYIGYEDDTCEYFICSDQVLVLTEGEKIDFVTVPYHFYNGHELPIVELRTNTSTLLKFEDGREYLIRWVNDTFG